MLRLNRSTPLLRGDEASRRSDMMATQIRQNYSLIMPMAEHDHLSRRAVSVMRRLAADPDSARYGAELMRDLQIPSGSLYPLLERLRRQGWLEAEKEVIDPIEAGRPARTYYQLTEKGRAAARAIDRDTLEELGRSGANLHTAVDSRTLDGTKFQPDQIVSGYLNAIEYIEIDAQRGEGRVEIVASNHHHNKGKHIDGTPRTNEWDDAVFLASFSQIRLHAADILGCLTGWTAAARTLAKPRVTDHQHHIITQRIDTGLDLAVPQWISISALLHLRRWQFFRDIDDGMVDLYVTPSSSNPWDFPYAPDAYNEEVARTLSDMRAELLRPVAGIVREVLMDPNIRLTCRSDAMWEAENMPVTGGDSYRLRFVVTENSDV